MPRLIRPSLLAASTTHRTVQVARSRQTQELNLLSRTLGVSDLCLPFAISIHGDNERASVVVRQHAQQVGLLRTERELRRFEGYARIAGYTHPRAADFDRLVSCLKWCAWLFLFDDQYDDNFEVARDLEGLREAVRTYEKLLRDGTPPATRTPLGDFTLQFRAEALALGGEAWLKRLSSDVSDYLHHGLVPAIQNWLQGRVPPLDEYMVQREYDSAVYTVIDMIEIGTGMVLSDEVLAHPAIAKMRRICTRSVAFVNDIMSFEKEVIAKGYPNNLLHVVMVTRRCSLASALDHVVRMLNDEVVEFMRLSDELPDWGPSVNQAVAGYISGMQYWMRGSYDWSLATRRYCSPTSPFPELQVAAQ